MTIKLIHICPLTLYFNLYENFISQENGIPLFTPAVQAYYAFDEALSELIEESVEKRIQRYRKAAELLRDGFVKMGLHFLIPRNHYSNCLTSLILPDGITYGNLHDKLKNKGFIIYAGQGNLNKNIFRIANMGDIGINEYERFLITLKTCLSLPT